MTYGRTESKQRILIDEAVRLIEARAKKIGVSPRTLVNQIVPEQAPKKPTKAQQETKDISAELLKRLAARDAGLT